MNLRKYKNICLVDSAYCLLLYLLQGSDEDVKNTFFFFGGSIPDALAKRFPHVKILSPHSCGMRKMVWWSWFSFVAAIKYRISGSAKLFVHDHLDFASQIVRGRSYTLLADAPHCFSSFIKGNGVYKRFLNESQPTIRFRMARLIWGGIWGRGLGMNEQCIEVLEEYYDPVPYIKWARHRVEPIGDRWRVVSEWRRKFILTIFELDDFVVSQIKNADAVLFTQPICRDAGIPLQDLVDIYKKALLDNGVEHVLVKVHPRDDAQYEGCIPGSTVLRTQAPYQLFAAMGCKCRVAITVCSSAVDAVGKNARIVRLGADIDPRIRRAYGML